MLDETNYNSSKILKSGSTRDPYFTYNSREDGKCYLYDLKKAKNIAYFDLRGGEVICFSHFGLVYSTNDKSELKRIKIPYIDASVS